MDRPHAEAVALQKLAGGEAEEVAAPGTSAAEPWEAEERPVPCTSSAAPWEAAAAAPWGLWRQRVKPQRRLAPPCPACQEGPRSNESISKIAQGT